MIDPLASVTEVKALPGFKLHLVFADGAQGVYDCKPILWGEAFEPLKDPKFFAKVFLEHGVPSWPNGADLDPGVLRAEIAQTGKTPAGKARKPRSAKAALVCEEAAPYTAAAVPTKRHPPNSESEGDAQ